MKPKLHVADILLLAELIAALISLLLSFPIVIFSLSTRAIPLLAISVTSIFFTPLVWLIKAPRARTVLRVIAHVLLAVPIVTCLWFFLGLFVFGYLQFL
ncbi:MAG: hypothetical protein IJV98_00040 [Clostridia bacterium]|nr:hypothetical protein [Clostridia bacterium]